MRQKNRIKGCEYYSINIAKDISRLPYSMKILLENIIRNSNNQNDISAVIDYKNNAGKYSIDYNPTRILMQDFTGVPAVVDLAAMRDAAKSRGIDPISINPKIPVDLIIDHSVQVDRFGDKNALRFNIEKEMLRNKDRYEFLKWGQKSFKNFRVVPPGNGICHQVNLEYLAKVVWKSEIDERKILYPDTLVGTDSHTTMINALSVLGWGVGGIEAEAVMLGEPISMLIPEVIGVNLCGKLSCGTTATDLVLTITNILRKENVVGKFVEFFGDGLKYLDVADRATISNMAPECGSTCNFFPIDQKTLDYLGLTGRSEDHISIVEEYAKTQLLWDDGTSSDYTKIITLDLSSVTPTLAGPKRPQDKIYLGDTATSFKKNYKLDISLDNDTLDHGSIVIAAITSCTNTSNPKVMMGAGLLAKKALDRGLTVKPWVKTSLAPGSKVVTEYLRKSGLQKYLDELGFDVVGYGCTTCIGNSGPLNNDISDEIKRRNLTVASILSGNRNFEGRIHPLVRANYLTSPPLVVAFAIAGRIDIDLTACPVGHDKDDNPVYLKDIWPSAEEIEQYIGAFINKGMFIDKYNEILEGDESWKEIRVHASDTYFWRSDNTYIKNPPYFDDLESHNVEDVKDARILALLGDSITTDHISPAGDISANSPAAKYLEGRCIAARDFNSYGSRRGNHEVMMRGTFANIRIRNKITPDLEGGYTIHFPSKGSLSIYDAAMLYKKDNVSLVVISGKEYGSGSSRDWAAKGTKLLGVKAVIAESFERIHRSNLIGMGVIPLKFTDGVNQENLNLTGIERISIYYEERLKPASHARCIIEREDNTIEVIELICAINTEKELQYLKSGGILQHVLMS